MDKIIPVILCGGSGTRLWPASREHHPKQFLKLFGDFSVLQETARRALNITGAGAENLVTVTSDRLQDKVREQMEELGPAAASHILAEPHTRNTAAAIAFAAAYVSKNFGADVLMWVLPSDHYIGDEYALDFALHEGVAAARENHIVTFGIRPTRPERGYGYIGVGKPLLASARTAETFIEKPDAATAQRIFISGNYLWNSGMFLCKTNHILNEFDRLAPHIIKGIESPGSYAALPNESFDKAIMENTQQVAVVPCDPLWSDIGSWENLWEIRDKDADGNAIAGPAACYDTKDCLIQTSGEKLIVCAGLKNIVFVETEDAILIADRNNSENLRVLLQGLKQAGANESKKPAKDRQFLKRFTNIP